ncbi:MAG: nuclear transport factor 2 family protein [Bdellovibrionales bacterium]|nr:nuclear transport factor 2 family protein [Bdellovibrionales bacterium]
MTDSKGFSHVIVRNRLSDLDRWLTGFAQHRSARAACGLFERQIFRSAENPSEVFVLLETSDALATKSFLQSQSLGEFKASLGVVGQPEYSFVELVTDYSSAKPAGVLDQVFAAQNRVDQMDAGGFADFFNPQGVFQFANLPPIPGPDGVKDFVSQFFSQLKSISHEVQNQFESDRTASVNGRVKYGMLDGRQIEIPFSSFHKLGANGKIDLWQAFVDVAPLTPHG